MPIRSAADNQPRRHHYLPRFFLKRWQTGEPPKVFAYQRFQVNAPIVVEAKSVASIGYEDELYSVRTELDPIARQAFESGFMSRLDNDAAAVLDQIDATGQAPSAPTSRTAWQRFLLSLVVRSPHHVRRVLEQLKDHDAKTLATLEARYERLRGPADPETFAAYMETDAASQSQVEELKVGFLRDQIDSSWLGNAIERMHWAVMSLSQTKHGFLTGDEPLMMSNGIGRRDGFLALPIGPRRAFIVAHDADLAGGFTDWPEKIEAAFNDAIAQQARRLVIADTPYQETFVGRRLGLRVPEGALGRQTWSIPARKKTSGLADHSARWR